MKKLNLIGLLALFLATGAAPILGMKKEKKPEKSRNYIQTLSPEVLTAIFEYLDARSHNTARQVCAGWRTILDSIPDYDYTKTLPLEILTAILTNNELGHYDRLQARLVSRLWNTTITETTPMMIVRPHAKAITKEGGNLLAFNRSQAVVAIPQLRLPRRLRPPSVTDADMLLTELDPGTPVLDGASSSSTRSLTPRSRTQSTSPRLSPREVVVRNGRMSPVPFRVFTDTDSDSINSRRDPAGTAPHPYQYEDSDSYSNSANFGSAEYSSDSE